MSKDIYMIYTRTCIDTRLKTKQSVNVNNNNNRDGIILQNLVQPETIILMFKSCSLEKSIYCFCDSNFKDKSIKNCIVNDKHFGLLFKTYQYFASLQNIFSDIRLLV